VLVDSLDEQVVVGGASRADFCAVVVHRVIVSVRFASVGRKVGLVTAVAWL
jgi:hypothetical protein